MEVRIETFDDIEIARIRHTGPYDKIGPCFMRLFEWAASVGARPGLCFSLSYDDAGTVSPEKLRSDACLELSTDAVPPQGIEIVTLAGGRHAVPTHQGPYDGIAEAYRRLFESWLPQSGEEPDGRPCMEIFRNTPRDTAPAGLLTDLCVPLRAAD